MSKTIIVTSIFSLVVLTACGGGGSTDTEPFLGGVNEMDPVAKLTLKQPRTTQVEGRIVLSTSEGGHKGDLEYVTQQYSTGTSSEVFKLKSGISSLDIKDLQRNRSTEVSCTDGSTLKVKIYADFSSGEVVTSGTHNGVSINCESKYDSVLTKNVFDQASITDLLHQSRGWGTNYNTAGYSNCTHFIEDMNGFSKNCTGAELVNYTITDTSGTVHKMTTKVTFEGDDN
ncbi:MAG: hypothetical protein KAG34_03855 [Cocleimonas sp.]|nr:hypothetical protein [Cocleimonas sp.]